MRRTLFTALILFLTVPLLGASTAIRYEFQQVTKSDPPTERSRVLVGTVLLDQGVSRVDYSKESTAGGGTWVISRNGGRDTVYIDPETRTYYARSSGELSDTLHDLQFKVSKLKIDTKYLGSGPVVSGYATEHHRLTATYDVSIALGPIPLIQHVQTVIDKWTTLAFGDVGEMYVGTNLPHSGDPEIDRILEAERSAIPGFPLRQVTTITTQLSESNLPKTTQLQVERSRRQTTELVVTKIGRAESDLSLFRIPAGYKPVEESNLWSPSGAYQTLTPEPNGP